MKILSLNAGSSSLKFGYHDTENFTGQATAAPAGVTPKLWMHGEIENIESANARFTIVHGESAAIRLSMGKVSIGDAAAKLIGEVLSTYPIEAIGCRVVHGGPRFIKAVLVTPEVLEEIRGLEELAPLHNAAAVTVIQTARRLCPDVPLVAVFDTAFHQTMPSVASTYALPFELCEKHKLRRYGFHGLSHQNVALCLQNLTGSQSNIGRLISCHLGNGASVCAIRDGRSIDTSMGLTPLEGLVMGTRSGDVDPGLILHLQEVLKFPTEAVAGLLNHKSGLLGISGLSNDVRELENAAQHGNERARLALETFAYRAGKYIGAYAVALEGLEALAFTGGIGQYSAASRARICSRLGVLGIEICASKNSAATGREPACISSDSSKAAVWIIPADEERQIARETHALLA